MEPKTAGKLLDEKTLKENFAFYTIEYEFIVAAMNEHAQQQATLFGEWIKIGYYNMTSENDTIAMKALEGYGKNKWYKASDYKLITTAELYSIFTEQQNEV